MLGAKYAPAPIGGCQTYAPLSETRLAHKVASATYTSIRMSDTSPQARTPAEEIAGLVERVILADLKLERMRAVQPPLWPEEEVRKEN